MIKEKEIPVINAINENTILKGMQVLADGIKATVKLRKDDGWGSEKIIVNFQKPHPIHKDVFMTKYFFIEDDGIKWGHDEGFIKLVKV